MKKYRVLMLVHEDLVPPDSVEGVELATVDWQTEYEVKAALQRAGHEVRVVGVYDDLSQLRKAISLFEPHIVFNLLEEFRGVATLDFNVVGYLELLKMPYTGCNPRGLMIARDKAISKKILNYHKIAVPRFRVYPKGQRVRFPKKLELPVIVKSLIEDASLGISQASVVQEADKLAERVEFIHERLQTDAIVEQYIPGRDLYVGVLGNKRLEVFPVWELKFGEVPEDFQRIATRRVKWNNDYREKYKIRTGRAAGISDEQAEAIRAAAKRIYRKLDLNGYARIDFRMSEQGELYLIEANPNPGIADGEEFTEAAAQAGIGFDQLIARIVSLGLSWHEKRE